MRGAVAEGAARARVRVRNLFSSAWFWLACGIAIGQLYMNTRGGYDSSTPPAPPAPRMNHGADDVIGEAAATCDSPACDSDDAAAHGSGATQRGSFPVDVILVALYPRTLR